MLVESEKQSPVSSDKPVHDKLLLSRLQLFRNVDLHAKGMDALLALCAYRNLEEGDELLSKEVENEYLFVLISGRLVINLSL